LEASSAGICRRREFGPNAFKRHRPQPNERIREDDVGNQGHLLSGQWDHVVSSNPLKVASGNVIGQHIVTFTPSYDHFRIYLVVNGSDIGAQFSDAEMRLDRLKLYTLDGVSL
jgi:hypothetical protein